MFIEGGFRHHPSSVRSGRFVLYRLAAAILRVFIPMPLLTGLVGARRVFAIDMALLTELSSDPVSLITAKNPSFAEPTLSGNEFCRLHRP
jgi:hypothetical protein